MAVKIPVSFDFGPLRNEMDELRKQMQDMAKIASSAGISDAVKKEIEELSARVTALKDELSQGYDALNNQKLDTKAFEEYTKKVENRFDNLKREISNVIKDVVELQVSMKGNAIQETFLTGLTGQAGEAAQMLNAVSDEVSAINQGISNFFALTSSQTLGSHLVTKMETDNLKDELTTLQKVASVIGKLLDPDGEFKTNAYFKNGDELGKSMEKYYDTALKAREAIEAVEDMDLSPHDESVLNAQRYIDLAEAISNLIPLWKLSHSQKFAITDDDPIYSGARTTRKMIENELDEMLSFVSMYEGEIGNRMESIKAQLSATAEAVVPEFKVTTEGVYIPINIEKNPEAIYKSLKDYITTINNGISKIDYSIAIPIRFETEWKSGGDRKIKSALDSVTKQYEKVLTNMSNSGVSDKEIEKLRRKYNTARDALNKELNNGISIEFKSNLEEIYNNIEKLDSMISALEKRAKPIHLNAVLHLTDEEVNRFVAEFNDKLASLNVKPLADALNNVFNAENIKSWDASILETVKSLNTLFVNTSRHMNELSIALANLFNNSDKAKMLETLAQQLSDTEGSFSGLQKGVSKFADYITDLNTAVSNLDQTVSEGSLSKLNINGDTKRNIKEIQVILGDIKRGFTEFATGLTNAGSEIRTAIDNIGNSLNNLNPSKAATANTDASVARFQRLQVSLVKLAEATNNLNFNKAKNGLIDLVKQYDSYVRNGGTRDILDLIPSEKLDKKTAERWKNNFLKAQEIVAQSETTATSGVNSTLTQNVSLTEEQLELFSQILGSLSEINKVLGSINDKAQKLSGLEKISTLLTNISDTKSLERINTALDEIIQNGLIAKKDTSDIINDEELKKDDEALSSIRIELEKITGLLVQLNLYKFSNKNLGVFVEQFESLTALLRQGFGFKPVSELDEMFSSLQEKLVSIGEETGGLNYNKAKNSLKDLAKEYQSYLDLGGTKSIDELVSPYRLVNGATLSNRDQKRWINNVKKAYDIVKSEAAEVVSTQNVKIVEDASVNTQVELLNKLSDGLLRLTGVLSSLSDAINSMKSGLNLSQLKQVVEAVNKLNKDKAEKKTQKQKQKQKDESEKSKEKPKKKKDEVTPITPAEGESLEKINQTAEETIERVTGIVEGVTAGDHALEALNETFKKTKEQAKDTSEYVNIFQQMFDSIYSKKDGMNYGSLQITAASDGTALTATLTQYDDVAKQVLKTTYKLNEETGEFDRISMKAADDNKARISALNTHAKAYARLSAQVANFKKTYAGISLDYKELDDALNEFNKGAITQIDFEKIFSSYRVDASNIVANLKAAGGHTLDPIINSLDRFKNEASTLSKLRLDAGDLIDSKGFNKKIVALEKRYLELQEMFKKTGADLSWSQQFNEFEDQVTAVSNDIKNQLLSEKGITGAIKSTNLQISKLGKSKLGKRNSEYFSFIKNSISGKGGLSDQLKKGQITIDQYKVSVFELIDSLKALDDERRKIVNEINKSEVKFAQVTTSDDGRNPQNTKKLREELDAWNLALQKGNISLEEYRINISKLFSGYGVENGKNNAIENKISSINEQVATLSGRISSYGTQFEKPLENFKVGVSDIEEQLRKGAIGIEEFDSKYAELKATLNSSLSLKGTPIEGSIRSFNQAISAARNYLTQYKSVVKELSFSDALNNGIGTMTAKVMDVEGRIYNLKFVYSDVAKSMVVQTKYVETEMLGFAKVTQVVGKRFKSLITYWVAMTLQPMSLVRYIRQIISVTKQYDDALTEMRKVSDESISTLKEYQKETYKTAKELGNTALVIQDTTAAWLRLGYSIKDAADAAKSATILYNVSEYESIDEATSALVAMKSAYKDLSNTEIIDIMNNIGNNFAISTDGLSTALQDAAASLTTAGNDIYEATALITAGNTVLQDPERVGKGIRTIALRLIGTEYTKEQLSDLGEDVSDFEITTQAKLQDLIKDLTTTQTQAGVDILNENGNLRSTYEILLDISKVWKQIAEEDLETGNNRQAALLEKLAGKNRSSILAAILQNPDVLEEVYASSLESAGSAEKENEKYLDSISGKLAILQSQLQELATVAINSDQVKWLLDAATNLLSVVTKIVDNAGLIPGIIGAIIGVLNYKSDNGILPFLSNPKATFKAIGTAFKEYWGRIEKGFKETFKETFNIVPKTVKEKLKEINFSAEDFTGFDDEAGETLLNETSEGYQNIIGALKGLTPEQQAAAISTMHLTDAQKQQILQAPALVAAQNSVAGATESTAAATSAASKAVNAFMSVGWMVVITAALTIISKFIDGVRDAYENTEELHDRLQDEVSDLKDEISARDEEIKNLQSLQEELNNAGTSTEKLLSVSQSLNGVISNSTSIISGNRKELKKANVELSERIAREKELLEIDKEKARKIASRDYDSNTSVSGIDKPWEELLDDKTVGGNDFNSVSEKKTLWEAIVKGYNLEDFDSDNTHSVEYWSKYINTLSELTGETITAQDIWDDNLSENAEKWKEFIESTADFELDDREWIDSAASSLGYDFSDKDAVYKFYEYFLDEHFLGEGVDDVARVFSDIDTYLEDAFDDTGIFNSSDISKMAHMLVARGTDEVDIESILSSLIEDKELSAAYDKLIEAIALGEEDGIVIAQESFNAIIDGLKEKYPVLTPVLDNIINSLIDSSKSAIEDGVDYSVADFFGLGDDDTPTYLKKMSDQVDTLQGALSTLHSAMEEYENDGKISIDTLQSVIDLGDDFLQYLVDEKGNITLDEEAMRKLIKARLENMRLQAIESEIDNITSIKDEADAQEYLTSKIYDTTTAFQTLTETKLKDAQATLRARVASGELSWDTYNQIMAQAKANIKRINALFDNTDLSIDSLIGGSGSGSSSSSGNTEIDFIEIRLEEIEQLANKVEDAIEDAVGAADKNALIGSMQDVNKTRINTLTKAIEYYSSKASEYLSQIPDDLKSAAQNGAIAISEFAGEENEATAEAIQNFREMEDAIANAEDEVRDLTRELKELEKQKFDNLVSAFEQISTLISDNKGIIEAQVNYLEDAGEYVGRGYYEALIEHSQMLLDNAQKERSKLASQMSTAISNGIDFGSEEWADMQSQVASVDQEIISLTSDIENYTDSLQQIEWNIFDKTSDAINRLSDEMSNLIDLMDLDEVTGDYSGFSADAIAAIGLYAEQRESASYMIEKTNEEISELNEMYSNGEITVGEYTERLETLDGVLWDNVSAYKSAEDAIRDIAEARVNEEIDSINKVTEAEEERVSALKDELKAQKDLYDYQKSLASSQKEVDSLTAQINARMGSTDAATIAEREQLEAELADKLTEIQDMQADKAYEDEIDSLDKRLQAFKDDQDARIEVLETALTNKQAVLLTALNAALENSSTVEDTISDKAEKFGIQVSDSITKPWKEMSSKVGSTKTTTFSFLNGLLSSTTGTMSSLSSVTKQKMTEITSTITGNIGIETQALTGFRTNVNSFGTTYKTTLDKIAGGYRDLQTKADTASQNISSSLKSIDTANLYGMIYALGQGIDTTSITGSIGEIKSAVDKLDGSLGSALGKYKELAEDVDTSGTAKYGLNVEYSTGEVEHIGSYNTEEEAKFAYLTWYQTHVNTPTGATGKYAYYKGYSIYATKYAKGGELDSLARSIGEDHIATIAYKEGERIITPEQNEAFLKLVKMSTNLQDSGVFNKLASNNIPESMGGTANLTIGNLLTVEGNVTEDSLPMLQKMLDKSKSEIFNEFGRMLTNKSAVRAK